MKLTLFSMNWNMYKIRIINGVWYWSICVSINNLVKFQLLLWTIQRFKISVVEAKMTFLVSNFCCSFKFHIVMLISCWTAVKDPFQPLPFYRLHRKKTILCFWFFLCDSTPNIAWAKRVVLITLISISKSFHSLIYGWLFSN